MVVNNQIVIFYPNKPPEVVPTQSGAALFPTAPQPSLFVQIPPGGEIAQNTLPQAQPINGNLESASVLPVNQSVMQNGQYSNVAVPMQQPNPVYAPMNQQYPMNSPPQMPMQPVQPPYNLNK